jgi:hypothetical protein
VDRGRDFPLSRLEIRLRCPRCGARRVRSFSSRRKVVRGSEDSVIQCWLSPVVFAAIRRVSSLGSFLDRLASGIRETSQCDPALWYVLANSRFKNPGLRRFACPTDPHGADQRRRKAKRPKRKKDHYKAAVKAAKKARHSSESISKPKNDVLNVKSSVAKTSLEPRRRPAGSCPARNFAAVL